MTAETPVASPPRVDELYRSLEEKVRSLRPTEDLGGLQQAYAFALQRHGRQTRESGEPYMVHPLMVSHILADMNMDLVCLQTGLLHDVVEDTGSTLEEIRKAFGEQVAHCVGGVTKLRQVQFYSPEEQQAESVRKMLLAMVTDIRVILVKLADRLHNMRTLGALSEERRRRIAQETLDIYAPIAHRLGMGKIRGELEDCAFLHLEPEANAEIGRLIESRRQVNEDFLRETRGTVEVKLASEGIPGRVDGRVKRSYSIYQKMKRQKISIEQVYDVLALRILTDSVKNCYAALGVIHNEWPPIPGRIKDFIATPRPNLYQSLHTSVIGPGGVTFEVQIRTDEMHRVAEEGIAAHWKYKEGHRGTAQDQQQMAWLRQLVEWQREMHDPGEFLSALKVDLYPEEVHCFTPRGRVIVLPRGATPIDFAYAIHTDVGHTCVGAKANGRIVPLRYALSNGDVVEIMTQSGHQPSKDWLTVVKTSRARSKIRHVINAIERAKAIEVGEKYLEREARRLGVQLSRIGGPALETVARDYGYGRTEDLYAALGFGKVSPRHVLHKVAPEKVPSEQPPARPAGPAPAAEPRRDTGELVLKVTGLDDMLLYRAGCCNPIRGEPIVGYVTRGRGIGVHAASCPNVQNLLYEVERRIEVEWARSAEETFPVKLVVHTDDRPGMLNQLTSVLFHENSNIRTLEARADDRRSGDAALIEMTVDLRDKKQLERIVNAIRRISGVRDIERVP